MAIIAFAGTGIMGGPMVRHLVQAGHELRLFNRTRAKAEAVVAALVADAPDLAARLSVHDNPAEAAEGCAIAISCVGNDDDLSGVTLGRNGLFETMPADSLFIDHTTVSARLARQLSVEGKSREIHCVDAPVSGGQAGAENGALAIMCGGSDDAMARAEQVMQAYAARIVHVGAAGAGQTTKMVNQICIAGILGGLSEGLRFAQTSGLDTDLVFEAISGGAAQSWQMDNRWKTMDDDSFDFGFAIDWMRKDLGLALEEARSNGATLPVAALVDQFYAELQKMGAGRQDTSALVRRIAKP
ncbi:NAD(P)-dependent oxidoreductase [Alterisphingorhabdus coralli]|uniref:NAD(P)-dependent oxidoreductase n=1 Tax=Alterisphingorhabdus coralli TaxID=3071408 RepID=A0AA97I0V5_9SPHN|nr:NAD(P)-dependent oxidoreductase [Parasphingorhabdus sp. SCSIO 66989]WOE74595.1 NAD(P)-dependent oxidoreductase [Parasphingorhabdus sp. SCSIO 66989]